MTTITRRKTRRDLTKLEDRIGVSLDPLTKISIDELPVTGEDLQQLLDGEGVGR